MGNEGGENKGGGNGDIDPIRFNTGENLSDEYFVDSTKPTDIAGGVIEMEETLVSEMEETLVSEREDTIVIDDTFVTADLLKVISEGGISMLDKSESNDDAFGFSADDGSFYELDEADLVEIVDEPDKAVKDGDPRIPMKKAKISRMPTMRLQAISDGRVPEKDSVKIKELVNAIYLKDEQRDGLYILPKKKRLVYGGKEYTEDYLNAIRDGAGMDSGHSIGHFKDDLYAIVGLLNNIPEVALRVNSHLRQEEGNYTIEFTQLKSKLKSLKFSNFNDKLQDVLKKSESIKLREILPENDELASQVEFLVNQKHDKYASKIRQYLSDTLFHEYDDDLRKIHSKMEFDFDIDLNLKKPLLYVEGIDHSREKLFELKFSYKDLDFEYFAECIRKFKSQLDMHFWKYRLKKK